LVAVVVCDLHERRSGVPAKLERLGLEVEWFPLVTGDYAIGGTALVERKTVRHLHASIVTGTFWPQVNRLRAVCLDPYLIIEGEQLDDGPLSPNAVRGCIVAALDLGIRTIRSRDSEDTAAWLQRLAARHGDRRPRLHKPAYSQRPTPMTPAAAAEAMLASVPGISSRLAMRLLEHFGSLDATLKAGPEGWADVDGIGPARARSLAESLAARHPRLEA
jgi:ERCC4-type nuclease